MIISSRQLRVAFVAAAAVFISACSQGSTPSTAGVGNLPSTAHAPRSGAVAPQAKAMLALAGHGANRSVIGKGEVITPMARLAPLQSSAIYDSIVVNSRGKTSSDIASEGFECCSTKEFGDGLVFTRSGARLNQVSVVLSSWGCQSGFWNTDNCQTTPGSNFEEPITANIYSVTTSNGSPVAVIMP